MASLRVLVLALGVAVGVFIPFVSVILASFGFEPGGIGLLTSLGALAFTIAVPAWGHLADVRLGRPRTLQVCAIGTSVALILLLGTWPAIVIAALFIGFWIFQSSWQPLADAITVNAIRGRTTSGGYARVRLLSSLGFAVATIAAGFLYDETGFAPAFVICAGAAMVMAIASTRMSDIGRADLAALDTRRGPVSSAPDRHRTWQFGSAGVALRIAPRLGLVLAAVALVHIGMISGYTFLSLRLVDLGGGPSDVALSASLSAAAEIPSMLVMGWVVVRIGLRGVFVASALIYAACFATWAVVDVPAVIIASRLFTGMAFAGVVVGVVMTIAVLLPPDLQATGQSLFQMVAFGIAAGLSNLVGGILYASIGPAAVFGLGAVLAVAAAAVGWFAFPARASRRVRQSRS